ncbi:uncharacterized protein B0I36DRAFT_210348, partial [Microdochium trichocladiopsis]
LTVHEAIDILSEFRGPRWRLNAQVLWSGMREEVAQAWANRHGLRTLTKAMGRLRNPRHDSCLRRPKSNAGWTAYIKGASALFAWCIAQEGHVIILTPPPNQRFHPSNLTSFQRIEGPVLAGCYGVPLVKRIDICHPQVDNAHESSYQLWLKDRVGSWLADF